MLNNTSYIKSDFYEAVTFDKICGKQWKLQNISVSILMKVSVKIS